MTSAIWPHVRGLDPTPPQARDWLKQELHGADYQSAWLDTATRWVVDHLHGLLDSVRHMAGLSPVVTILLSVLVLGLLVWVLPRVRREPASSHPDGPVLQDPTLTAQHYRDLAARALGDRRYDDAVLDGFRAIAKDMSDRRVLDDAPGSTAHEVSLALASSFPRHAEWLARAADLFDSVRYGHRRANPYQASEIQQLDAELVTTRPPLVLSPEKQQV